jgi:hypothetical protein
VWNAGARDSQSLRLNPSPLALSLNLSDDASRCNEGSEQAMELSPHAAELSVAPQARISSAFFCNLMPDHADRWWPTAAGQQHAQPAGNEIEVNTSITGSGSCVFS